MKRPNRPFWDLNNISRIFFISLVFTLSFVSYLQFQESLNLKLKLKLPVASRSSQGNKTPATEQQLSIEEEEIRQLEYLKEKYEPEENLQSQQMIAEIDESEKSVTSTSNIPENFENIPVTEQLSIEEEEIQQLKYLKEKYEPEENLDCQPMIAKIEESEKSVTPTPNIPKNFESTNFCPSWSDLNEPPSDCNTRTKKYPRIYDSDFMVLYTPYSPGPSEQTNALKHVVMAAAILGKGLIMSNMTIHKSDKNKDRILSRQKGANSITYLIPLGLRIDLDQFCNYLDLRDFGVCFYLVMQY